MKEIAFLTLIQLKNLKGITGSLADFYEVAQGYTASMDDAVLLSAFNQGMADYINRDRLKGGGYVLRGSFLAHCEGWDYAEDVLNKDNNS